MIYKVWLGFLEWSLRILVTLLVVATWVTLLFFGAKALHAQTPCDPQTLPDGTVFDPLCGYITNATASSDHANYVENQDMNAFLGGTWIRWDGGPAPFVPVPHHGPVNPKNLFAVRTTATGATTAPPGYWMNSGFAAPCPNTPPGLTPYTTWQDPITGNIVYFRGDMDVDILAPNQYPTLLDAIFGNHTHGMYDFRGMQIGIIPELGPANFYPAPPSDSQACTQWFSIQAIGGVKNTATCPLPSGDVGYANGWKQSSVWLDGLNFYQPQIAAQCNGTQPTITPTPTRTLPAFTPTVTPTPGPNQFQDWIYQVAAEGLIVGCSPTLYCPGDNTLTWQGLVTRAQQAVYMLKAEHGASYVPPPCVPPGKFTDVPCLH